MKHRVIKYWRIGYSKILHPDGIHHKCHYFMRGNFGKTKPTTLKRRTDHVCDECQRQQRLARRKK